MTWIISSAIENIPFVLDGVGYLTGPAITSWQRKENAVKTHQYVQKGFFQAIQVWATSNRIRDAMTLAKSTFAVPPAVRWICIGAPIALALVRQYIDPLTIQLGKDHPAVVTFVRRNFCLIEDHIGTGTQVVALVSYIAIGFFGQPLLGAFGVVCVTVGLCERFGFEACKEHNPLSRLLLAASGVFTFMQVDVIAIGKGLSLANIVQALQGKGSLAVEDSKRQPKANLGKTPENIDILLGLDTTFKNLAISSNHLDLVETIPNNIEKCDFGIFKGSYALSFDGKIDQEVIDLVENEPSFIYSVDREKGVAHFLESKKAAFHAFVDKMADSKNETLHRMGTTVGLNYKKLNLDVKDQQVTMVKLALEMEKTSGENVIYMKYNSLTEKDSNLTLEQKIYRKLGEVREKLFWESGMSEDAGRAFGVPSLTLYPKDPKKPYMTNEKEYAQAVNSFNQAISTCYYQTVFTELKAFDKEIKEWFQKNMLDFLLTDKSNEKITKFNPEEKEQFAYFIDMMRVVMTEDSSLSLIEAGVKKDFLANNECPPWYKAYLVKLGIMENQVSYFEQILNEEKKNDEKSKEEIKKEEVKN